MPIARATRPSPHALRQARGFTLVELVVVVVVLGVLAAASLTRLFKLQTDARRESVNHLAGAVRASAQQAMLRCRLVTGCGTNRSTSMTLPGGTVVWMLWFYPEAGSGLSGIELMLDTAGFQVATPTHWQTEFRVASAPDPSRCLVTYAQAGGTSNGTVDSVYTLSTDTTGC